MPHGLYTAGRGVLTAPETTRSIPAAWPISSASRSRIRATSLAWAGGTGNRPATSTRSVRTPPTVSTAATSGLA